MNSRVCEILTVKGSTVYTLDPDKTVFDAVCEMSDKGVGSLIVTRGEGLPLGIISEQDCRKVILNELNPRKVTAADLMSKDLVVVSPSTTVEECMRIMTEKRIRHLPVLEHDVLKGILSIGDVVKFLYNDRERMVENLEKYITGSM